MTSAYRSVPAWIRSASLATALAWAGPVAAIDTLVTPASQVLTVAQARFPVRPATSEPSEQPETAARSKAPATQSAAAAVAATAPAGTATAQAAEPPGRYQPYVLALAGALLMGYIGLRRPRE